MAMQMGQRFEVAHDRVFPNGAWVVGPVEPVKDYEAKKGSDDQKRDKVSGLRLWRLPVMDADEDARQHEIKVKIAAEHQPVPPPLTPGTPFRAVEFDGLTVSPWVDDRVQGRPRLAWSMQATGMHAPGKANGKAAPAAPTGGAQ